MKKLLFLLAIAAFVTANGQKSQVFITNGKAIKGYDPVAFFTEQKPVLGDDKFSTAYNNATWYFSSQLHLDSFKTAPEKYAPQYGGYCAFGAAEGHKAPTQTDTWTIFNNKLYFNYNQKVKAGWLKNTDQYIKAADSNWNTIRDVE